MVKGIIFAEFVENLIASEEEVERLEVNFFPTGVGGLVGNAQTGSIHHNYLGNVLVTSASEGASSGMSANNVTVSSTVISTVGNYMADLTKLSANSNAVYDYSSSSQQTGAATQFNKVSFNAIASGFGGVFGTTNSTVVGAVADATLNITGNPIINNYLNNTNVSASLGVNTGSFYGFVNNGESPTIATPSLMDNISVDGAYNVGGVVGNYTANALNGFSASSINRLAGVNKVSINVQTNNITGMYVGGLFGKVNVDNGEGDASNLVITSNSSAKISINTNNSYYIGGLIGRLEGNLRGEDASSSTYNSRVNCSADGSGSSVGLEISGSDVENFGGLVGMLKVAPNANGITAEVTGAHQFAFTVNTIENSNYYDGPSTYDYNDERSAELDLVAQAYYVNKDSFNISASKDATLYDGENDCNPLLQNTGAWGWHKTYTGFKTLQRIIPAGVGANYSGTNEWDAIQPIYDATNITHVGTLKELVSRGLLKENDIILVGSHNALLDAEKIDYGKVITDETGKIKVIQSNKDGYPEEKDGSNIEICDEDFINFTVYEDESGHPKLYSRLGVGTVYVNDKNQFATPVDEKKKITERADGEISKYYIDLNNSKNYTQALHYLYWGERKGDDFNNKKFITVGGQEVNMVTNPTEEKYLVYKIKTAFYSQYAETDSASTDKANDVYFQFDVIYSNYSSPDDVADDVLPVDGSIFNVVGVQTTAARNKIKSENDNLQWLRWVLEVVSWIETAIVGLAALGALLTLFIPGVQFVGFGVLGALLGLGGGLVYGSIYTHQWRKNSVTYKSVQQTYINRADQSNGFLSSTYRRQVQYDGSGDNWIMQTADFSCILINGYYYQNYSCERPSDYYSARYTIVASNLQTDYPEGKYLAHLPDLSNDASYQISYWDAKGEKITETDNYAAAVGWIICDKNIELGNSLTPNLLDGKNCALIMKTYEYNNGVYYRCVNTSEMAYYPTQMFNANLYADADGYINYNGSIFVKGTFNGPDALRPYTMDDTNNFLHYDAAGKLTINNKEWTPRSSDSNEAKCDDLTLEFRAQNQLNLAAATADSKNKIGSSLKITNTAANHGTIEEVTTSYNENDEPTGEIYNEGFSFMRNAYYTASGKHINKYISTNNYQTIDPIVAAFIGPTTVQPEGVEGVDYLQYNASYTITDEEGHQQNRVIPIFYTFNGKATNQSGVDYVKNETKLGILNSDGSIINENSTIYINTYPDSFVNPYKDTDKGSDMHDENYYIDLAILDANVEEIDQSLYLQYDATYFYYEGGYVTKEDDDSANKTVFMPIENEYYYTNSQLGSVGSRTYTFTYSYIEIDIYDKNGNKQTTGTGVNNAFTLQDLVNGWDKYKDYYLEDVSKLNYSDQLKEMYKVSNNFYVNGNKANFTSGYSESGIDGDLQDDQGTHAPNVPYTIAYLVNSSFVVHNGVLSSMVTKYYSANGMNYNSNKYLANDKYQIYTRYKFVKNEKSDLNPFASGVWCYEGKLSDEKPKYYLFVKGKLPNAGLTTNLVESVVITFAAKGKTIYIGDMQNGLQGQFTSEIKIH